MKKVYAVLVSFDKEKGRDVRIRCDVDKHPKFKRLGDGMVLLDGDNSKRLFYILYEGEERKAKRLGEHIKFGFDALDIVRSIQP